MADTPPEAYNIAARLSGFLRGKALPKSVAVSVEIPAEIEDPSVVRIVAHAKMPLRATGKYQAFRATGLYEVGDLPGERKEHARIARDFAVKFQIVSAKV